MSSNTYIAKTNQLTTSTNKQVNSNREPANKALRCIGQEVIKVVKAEYVTDLFKDLRQTNTPLRTVTDTVEQLCRDIKTEQKTKLMRDIMKYKQESAHRTLEKAKRQYTNTFNNNKQHLINSNIYRQSILIIREEKNKQRHKYRNKRIEKVKHLRNKNKQTSNQKHTEKEENDIEGIIIGNQTIPEDYKSKLKKYGDVKLTKDEEEALQLPPKYCVYNKIQKLECQIELEKTLSKMRWSSKDYENTNGELNEPSDNNTNNNSR